MSGQATSGRRRPRGGGGHQALSFLPVMFSSRGDSGSPSERAPPPPRQTPTHTNPPPPPQGGGGARNAWSIKVSKRYVLPARSLSQNERRARNHAVRGGVPAGSGLGDPAQIWAERSASPSAGPSTIAICASCRRPQGGRVEPFIRATPVHGSRRAQPSSLRYRPGVTDHVLSSA